MKHTFFLSLLLFFLIVSCSKEAKNEVNNANNIDSLKTLKKEGSSTPPLQKNIKNEQKENVIEVEKILILEYSRDSRDMVLTEITPTEVTTGSMNEESGDFYEIYESKKNSFILMELLKILPLETYYKSDEIGTRCGSENFYIELSIKKEKEEQMNIIFINHFDPNLYKACQLINKNLTDSLHIQYSRGLINNCE